MRINTNRVLLETFTNTTINNPKKSDSVIEFISILFIVAIIACYCCCLNYKTDNEKEKQNSNSEIQTRREINFQKDKEKQPVIEL